MGQAGVGGGVPNGYQPSELPANQLAGPSKFVDDAAGGSRGWGPPPGQSVNASTFPPPVPGAVGVHGSHVSAAPPPPDRSFPIGVHGNFLSNAPPPADSSLRHADRLASFSTDVDAACDRVEGGIRHSSFDTDVDVARKGSKGLPYPPLDTDGGCEFGTRPSYQNQLPSIQSNAFNSRPALNSFSSIASSQFGDLQPASRDSWEVGCVVEVFSATVGRWYVARIMQVQPANGGPEVLTVQFPTDDGPKMKSTYRSDPNLEAFGVNIRGELPPGFQRRPSQSRPGQTVYLDQTTGQKYASEELAWRIHLERLFEQPVGSETVAALPSAGAVKSAPVPNQFLQHPPPSPCRASPKAMSLAELQNGGPKPMSLAELQYCDSGMNGAVAHGYLEPVIEDDLSGTDGKVALPSFGDARQSSQAAYLGYMGNPALGVPAPIAEDESAVYRTPAGARVPQAARPPVRACNPGMQVWQEDPFSQWRH